MASRASLLKTLLVAVATAPALACGDSSDSSSTGSTSSSAGAGSGGSTAGSGGSTAGSGGSTAGAGGSTAGSGGSEAGSGGSTAGGGGVSAGSGGSTAGSGGSEAGSGGSTAGGGGSTAGSAGSTAGSAGSTAGSGGAAHELCPGGTPLLVGSSETGYESCQNGSIHRREVLDCPSLLPRAEACKQADLGGNCKSDSDCMDAPNGFCVGSEGGFQAPGCFCQYGCTKDSDCGAGSVCLCGEPVGHCVVASCTSDKDCNGGGCTSYGTDQICFTFGFACQNPADTCGGNADCTSPELCLPEGDHRICKNDQPCAVGRPLLVDDAWRFARLTARGDWAA